MTVKVYTGSGQFSVKDNDDKQPSQPDLKFTTAADFMDMTVNKEEPQYINARGGTETIVSEYDKLSHPYCGTPKCCGQCATANKTDEPEYMDEDYSKHLERFFKGKETL